MDWIKEIDLKKFNLASFDEMLNVFDNYSKYLHTMWINILSYQSALADTEALYYFKMESIINWGVQMLLEQREQVVDSEKTTPVKELLPSDAS